MKKYLLWFWVCLVALAGFGMAQAQMSQTPLLTAGSSVPPNIVFTIDDSGSMAFECLPDNLCVGDYYVGTTPGDVGSTYKDGVATTTLSSLFNRQMRSGDYNPQYYDPSVTYLPWRKEDGTRYPAYTATAAPYSALAPGTTVNLVRNQTFNTVWCTSKDNCNGSNRNGSYYVAQYFTLISGTGSSLSNFTQTLITTTVASYTKAASRQDCAGTSSCTFAEEAQNFSNWFTYASRRIDAAIGGTAEAFYSLPLSYRLGYGRINKSTSSSIDGVNARTVVRGLRPYTGTDREDFYTWLSTVTPSGGTPLRRAMDDVGQYFTRTDNRGPWSATPGTTDASAHLGCRRAFHILMTDGFWSTGSGTTAVVGTGNQDGTAGPTVTGPNGQSFTYNRPYPYRDNQSDTLADVAMYYWKNDLRPDLTNEVKPTTGNPAFWQHLVNYTIAFGLRGNLNNPADLPALTANTKNWGTPSSNDNAKIDDLWHAALNSRGLSLSAVNAVEYANALRSIINDIDERNGSEAGVAVSGRFLSANSRKYVPEYRTNLWVGELTAVSLDADGNDDAVLWKASEKMPAAADRKIFTFKDSATKGITFTWTSLTAQGMTSLLSVSAGSGAAMVNYIRGDATGEGTVYRTRSKKLGDIVNSSPVLVKDSLDMQYDFLPSTTAGRSTYREYLRNKKNRGAQIFVGANDGMVHGFDDSSGTETFAFIPRALLGELRHLSEIPYFHQYYVDGPMVEADVYDPASGAAVKWRNLVIGSGGAGAQNLFAINAPVPSSPVGTGTVTPTVMPPGASDILWEVSSSSSGYEEMGNIIASPESGLMRNGDWAVITGNGYMSASGKAQLFIINAVTGALIKRIDTGIGSGNGLGGVRVVRDSQQRIVSAYAGDLKGNLWKFDLSGSSSGSWVVAFGSTAASPKPLFKAVNRTGDAEPITAAPQYVNHPLGGVLVLAGTGKLFEDADPSNTQERTLYGLWDKVKVGATSDDSTLIISGTTTLVLQQISTTISITTTSGDLVDYWSVTSRTVDYATQRGWMLPLTMQSGQRMIYDPQVALNRVFFETVVPGASVVTCQASSGVGYNFVLDPFSGAAGLDGATFDTNGDGVIDSLDNTAAVAYKSNADGGDGILLKAGGKSQGVTVSPTSSKQFSGDKNSIRRAWRQIVNPPT
ncbi:MAG: PilC/PilY family type IV pilus protein [Burkholderiaceae bacterium]|nr:PilC/PilY family type IV pilus protein [Burkholderiaceae bacterium]